jgi:hypothetical protein
VTVAWFCALYALAVWTTWPWFVAGVAFFAASNLLTSIGDPETLQTRFAASSAGAYLAFVQQSEGLRASVQSARTLDVPGAGTLKLRYARPTTSPTDDNSTEVVP